ncbi:hypothetical protein F5Y10DRAFT_248218 [Nemania abortiva]|nr:hypothetical protein F5Y10DRAFT_248218 [Nemania abortiva]
MEWISRRKKLSDGDIAEFKFFPDQPCVIQTIRLRRVPSGEVEVFENEIHKSERDYIHWIDQSPSWPDEPIVALVMHKRLDMAGAKATYLPYGRNAFIKACDRLYQHRSVADVIRRKSGATFTSKTAAVWKDRPELGPAVIYNCKSDTISPTELDDLVLSVTHFPKKSTILAVAYGCTDAIRDYIVEWLQYVKTFAFSPLLFPMVWAELERQRLINKVDRKTDDLWENISRMNDRFMRYELPRSSLDSSDSRGAGNMIKMDTITQNGKDTTVHLWVDVNTLKSGLESFLTELKSMLENSQSPLENDEIFGQSGGEPEQIRKHSSDRIQNRLNEMMTEIKSKVKYTNGLLEGITLGMQTESNHSSRRDALANIYIATESKKDSRYMRDIALLGMIFLPGTFFATLFSMTFFNWIPQDSNQVISPWIAIYFGFVVASTAGIIWGFRARAKRYKHNHNAQLDMLARNDPGAELLWP